MFVVELRLRLEAGGLAVEFSQTVILFFARVCGHILHLDPAAGTAEGLTITQAGWLQSRQRFVCHVRDSVDAQAAFPGDWPAICRHYVARGWAVPGGGPASGQGTP